ncbi:MAG: DUF1592 domain-containing protein [Planctomycetaceae bacterium]
MSRLHRHRTRLWAALVAAVPGLGGAVPAGADGRTALVAHCGDCHCGGMAEGRLDLDAIIGRLDERPVAGGGPDEAAWMAVVRNLRAETMPPPDGPPLAADDRRRLVEFVERDVFALDPGRPDPGRPVLRRLNRTEYQHTVDDLTGLAVPVADDLPADDTGYGFDTIGDVLSMPPLLVEKYLILAARVGDAVVETARVERVAGVAAYPAAVRRVFPLGPPPDDPRLATEHLRGTVARLADRAFRGTADAEVVERLCVVARAEAERPDGGFERAVAAALAAILSSPRFLMRIESAHDTPRAVDDPTASAVPVSDVALASRLSYFLWGSMPDDELLAVAREGRLHAELDRQVIRMIEDRRSARFVASFVGQWLRTRDVEATPFDLGIVARARGGRLRGDVFNDRVRPAMRRETEMLFEHLLRRNRPPVDLLMARETFLNEPLARFYDIPDVEGPEMRLVSLAADSHRGGLLTHGSFLTVTSNPTRTAPVKRGLFVVDTLLGMPVPPPPPNVPPLEAADAPGRAATMREKLARHRSDPLCASCHERMDPPGLALESYNAIGQWLGPDANAGGTPGKLATGETFADARELAEVIAGPRRHNFHRCLAERMLVYAIGRGLEYHDGPSVDAILAAWERDGAGLQDLVRSICRSVPFRMRRPTQAAGGTSP